MGPANRGGVDESRGGAGGGRTSAEEGRRGFGAETGAGQDRGRAGCGRSVAATESGRDSGAEVGAEVGAGQDGGGAGANGRAQRQSGRGPTRRPRPCLLGAGAAVVADPCARDETYAAVALLGGGRPETGRQAPTGVFAGRKGLPPAQARHAQRPWLAPTPLARPRRGRHRALCCAPRTPRGALGPGGTSRQKTLRGGGRGNPGSRRGSGAALDGLHSPEPPSPQRAVGRSESGSRPSPLTPAVPASCGHFFTLSAPPSPLRIGLTKDVSPLNRF